MGTAASCRLLLAIVLGLDHAFQPGELFTVIEIDQGDALRRTAHLADRRHLGPDKHSAGRDQHHFIAGTNQRSRDDSAVPRGLLDRDHALGAAAMAGVPWESRRPSLAIFRSRPHPIPPVLAYDAAA